MLGAAILWVGLATVGAGDYLRPFDVKLFDQASFDAESFGDKKILVREADGLHITLKPGEPEAGWKTPAQMRIGGDCTISATIVIRKLPKPAQEDGVAIGIAVATQNVDQPEATLLREVETDGKDVYRPVSKAAAAGQQPMNQPRFTRFGEPIVAKAAKPERHTFPAKGQTIRLEIQRQGQTLRYQVFDELSGKTREIGQCALGPADIAGVKLFVSNRNGAEPVDVVFKEVKVQADRITGLGTAVRSVYGTVVLGEPTALEGGVLVVGGQPPTPAAAPANAPPGANPAPPGAKPAAASTLTPAAAAAPAAAPVAVTVAAAPAAAPAAPVVQEPAKPATPAAAPAADGSKKPADAKPVDAKPAAPPAPKARIPLDEVESITFERAVTLTGRFIGQPNVDTTGPRSTDAKDAKPADAKKGPGDDLSAPTPGTVVPVAIPKVEPQPNGIRDLHLTLSSLREVAIRQIMIQGQTDKGAATWQLDTAGSPAWPMTLRRAGTESWADIFLEPPDGDFNDKQFTITITYADGQNANVQVKATAHTDPKLAFDPKAPTPALDARVYLSSDEQLFGKLESITEETLSLTTPWGDRLDVPMTRVVGVFMGMPDHKETPESFAKRIKAQASEDLLLARAKDGEVVAINGLIEGVKDNSLTFVYQDKSRSLPLKQVEGLILAARPAAKPLSEVRPTFKLAGGIAISGRWTKIEADAWQVEAPWGQVIKLPAATIQSVRVRGGQMAYLSDLEPIKVDEEPYFGRRSPYRKDVNLDGGPLKIEGQLIEKGLAVHSRSSLTYELERHYTTFEVLVGFDEAGKKKGRVDCRIFADGKELYANPDLRADGPPVKLVLPVTGAEQLRLVVDFGANEDTGDRVIWGNARLYRRGPKPEAASTPAKPAETKK